jgi:cytochrome c-type biogenesis protein
MLMGIAFAAGWTPCVGPILGSILLVTATTGGGVSLLVAFSLGMALPYLLAALMVKQAGRWVDRLTGSLHRFQFVMGMILILFGVLIFMGLLTRLALIIS